MGVARIFQRGGHTDSYIGYSPNCHLNIVGCLLTKRLTEGGVTGIPGPPPPLATPMKQYAVPEEKYITFSCTGQSVVHVLENKAI